MKHAKMLILFAFLLCLLFTLAACGGGEDNGDGTGTTGTETESVTESVSETQTEAPAPQFCENEHVLLSGADFYTCENCDFQRAVSQGFTYDFLDRSQTTCEITGIGTCTDTELYIPTEIDGHSVLGIVGAAFQDVDGVTAVVIPSSVKNMGSYVFKGCSSLESLEFAKNSALTGIGTQLLDGCNRLTRITLQAGGTKYHSAGNCLINTSTKTLVLGCKESKIPTDFRTPKHWKI